MNLSVKGGLFIGGTLATLLLGWMSFDSIFENLEAGKIMVVQSPIEGRLDWHTTPGVKWQGFGRITKYRKGDIFAFDQDGKNAGIDIRFNDGGHGRILGSVQYALPEDTKHLNLIHARYGSQEAVESQIVQKATEGAIYLVGPLMSSRESYGERRNDLIHYVMDQIQLGIYRTRQTTTWVEDALTKERKQVVTSEIVMKDGKPERQSESPLAEFGVRAYNFTIKQMPYDQTVEAQIKQQQQIAMDVQTAIANAKKAEQAKLTAEAEGQAEATRTKWQQEAIKAKAVTLAQQEKEVAITAAERNKQVAELAKQEAEFIKAQQILLGEGEAKRKQLVLDADGALAQKLDAFTNVNFAYAKAIGEYKGAWVPGVVMSGPNGNMQSTAGSGAQALIDLLTVKTAQDLGLDLSVKKQGNFK